MTVIVTVTREAGDNEVLEFDHLDKAQDQISDLIADDDVLSVQVSRQRTSEAPATEEAEDTSPGDDVAEEAPKSRSRK
jgi:hypothetical protein